MTSCVDIAEVEKDVIKVKTAVARAQAIAGRTLVASLQLTYSEWEEYDYNVYFMGDMPSYEQCDHRDALKYRYECVAQEFMKLGFSYADIIVIRSPHGVIAERWGFEYLNLLNSTLD